MSPEDDPEIQETDWHLFFNKFRHTLYQQLQEDRDFFMQYVELRARWSSRYASQVGKLVDHLQSKVREAEEQGFISAADGQGKYVDDGALLLAQVRDNLQAVLGPVRPRQAIAGEDEQQIVEERSPNKAAQVKSSKPITNNNK